MADHPILAGEQHWEGQDLSEVTINERFDRMAHPSVLVIQDRDLSAPPGSENDGESWIVRTPGTGAWANHDGEVATWYSGYRFRKLRDGEILTILDEGTGVSGKSVWYNNNGILNKIWDP